MSYWCKISFKTLPASELFGFFQEFKAKAIERMPEIAKENAVFSPMMRAYHFKVTSLSSVFWPAQPAKAPTSSTSAIFFFILKSILDAET